MRRLMERVVRPHWQVTEPGLMLWTRIRGNQLGVEFRRDVEVGPYVVDFVCPERRLIVELEDDRQTGPEDHEREAFFGAQGFRVLRFPEREAILRPEAVIAALWLALESGPGRPIPAPSPRARIRSRGARGNGRVALPPRPGPLSLGRAPS